MDGEAEFFGGVEVELIRFGAGAVFVEDAGGVDAAADGEVAGGFEGE